MNAPVPHSSHKLDAAGWVMLACAVLAVATAALGHKPLHMLFKPLTLVVAMAWVAGRALAAGRITSFDITLLMGLAASLAGDVLLMLPGLFIQGLVAFLIAHLAYIEVFRQRVGLFPRPAYLLLTLAIGAAMYAFLWQGGLPAPLRMPVAAYVVVIAAMAAQALGRAAVLGDRASRAVAVGACFFMLSDALLATNRFVTPLPLSAIWVLGTYYVAQFLIAGNAQRSAR